jgi:hypothetical protein
MRQTWVAKMDRTVLRFVRWNDKSSSFPAASQLLLLHRYNSNYWQQKSQWRGVYSSSSQATSNLRRSRKFFGKIKEIEIVGKRGGFGKLQHPYAHGEDNVDEYFKKTSLSPWVPMPDSAARKMMDLANVGPSDFHVDLGSGDGRVNFHAIDCGVSKSLGVDVDEKIVQVARDRLVRRHPQPDLEFVVADLLKDTSHPVWYKIQQATVITMYFAAEALQVFRPILEAKLAGHTCKVLTCGYEMPGWHSRTQEVVNGMQIHLYEWGTPFDDEDQDDMASLESFMGEDILQRMPTAATQQRLEGQKFAGMNVIDRTSKNGIRGYNPNLKFEVEDFDEDWDVVTMDTEDDKAAMDKDNEPVNPPSKKSPCSKR